MREARLILDDGSQFIGRSIGYDANTVGEVVFNTAMTGYPESLTDPSYAGQILVTTFPLIGNYGVPDAGMGNDGLPLFMESERIYPKALVVADYSKAYSHWNAAESLESWLKREKIPAITGIDTRRLTKVLRESGVMMGKIVIDGINNTEDTDSIDYGSVNWVEKVSCKEVITYQPTPNTHHQAPKRVVLVDCGVKANIIRCLVRRGVEVIRVPWTSTNSSSMDCFYPMALAIQSSAARLWNTLENSLLTKWYVLVWVSVLVTNFLHVRQEPIHIS